MTEPTYLLGIEIGGTKLQVGLGRPDGSLVALERGAVDPKRGAAGIRDAIPELVATLRARHDLAPEGLHAVGVGFGGPVDAARGRVIESHQIAGWTDFALADWVRATLGVSLVAVENDAATAALGEARAGAGVGQNPVLYVTIGSGVGGGLIVDGQIYRGRGQGALELGHLRVGASGFERIRTPRTVEDLASGWSIARAGQALVAAVPDGLLAHLVSHDASRVTPDLVVQAAREGSSGAEQILDEAHAALGEALAHAVTLLAPSVVILGGGVSLIGDDHWFEPIRRIVAGRVMAIGRETPIVPAALGEAVVVHGALARAADLAHAGA